MSKTRKIWLGIFTFLPFLGFVLYILFFILLFFNMSELAESQENFESTFFAGFGIVFALIFLSVLSALGVMIYYIVHAVQNPEFDSNKQLMWIIILLLASGIGNIIYYIVVIFPAKPQPALPKN